MNKQFTPLISVIVPVYKVEKYIENCVESIKNQTYSNLEIILVDDGSPDKCGEICDGLASSDDRICVIHKKNGGLSSARNIGIEQSHGEYIGFVDSDDTIEPHMYQKLSEAIQKDNTMLSVCSVNYVFEDGKILTKKNKQADCCLDFEQAMIEMNSHRLFDMGACSKLYDRSLFENIRFPVGKLSEDYYVMYKIFVRAQRISYVSEPSYNYLQRNNSITHNRNINYDHEYAAKEQMEYLKNNFPELNVLGHVSYASAALTVYDSFIKNNVKCSEKDLKHFRNVVIQNKKYIKQAKFLTVTKKIQFYLFLFNVPMYNFVFGLYRKVERI